MSPAPILKTFPQVDHHEATGELAAIYEDIHATMRLPWVAFAIRVLSQFPHFVPAAWAALKPNIATRYAEHGADLVRRAAIVEDVPPPPDPQRTRRARPRLPRRCLLARGTVITVTFAPDGEAATLMTFRQAPFDSDVARQSHGQGWGQVLDSFGRFLVSRS